jgi:hypothetical protein
LIGEFPIKGEFLVNIKYENISSFLDDKNEKYNKLSDESKILIK